MSIQSPPREITETSKIKDPEKIRQMFSKVAPNYDRANSVLSGGVHHLWRKKLVKISGAKPGQAVLDCATGTGDLALEFKRAVGPTGRVVGTDFCAEMLASAPAKSAQMGLQVEWSQADAMNLQFKDNEFDFTSISFGIRNVADPEKALKEMARVTKPGGSVLVLEFGQVEIPCFSQLYNFYSQKVLPIIGGFVTGQQQAYKYLQESSAEFPCRGEFLKLMEQTGSLEETKYWSLTGGIAYIYKGVVK
jgi:demethylmenaquinone methyltransferase/2-methoxy-6-polyprenyl-1,4-benzoquinol methylase